VVTGYVARLPRIGFVAQPQPRRRLTDYPTRRCPVSPDGSPMSRHSAPVKSFGHTGRKEHSRTDSQNRHQTEIAPHRRRLADEQTHCARGGAGFDDRVEVLPLRLNIDPSKHEPSYRPSSMISLAAETPGMALRRFMPLIPGLDRPDRHTTTAALHRGAGVCRRGARSFFNPATIGSLVHVALAVSRHRRVA
jgi:hypothetical protein